MKTIRRLMLFAIAAGSAAFAQQWEFGGMAGGSFLSSVNVSNSFGSATAGLANGPAFGGYVGFNSYQHIGGELHYGFLMTDLKLSGNGTTATFSGQEHVIHYDVIFHTNGDKKTEFFAAVGGGMKLFRGTGAEAAYQPLYQFGYFTKTQQVMPMGSVGGGVKIVLSRKMFLRAEFRDYISMFPNKVIAAPSGTKYGSVLHNFVPMVGLGFVM